MKIETKNSKSDILVIVLGFTIIGLLVNNHWVIWSVVSVGVVALFSPHFESFILFIWHKISQGMGWIMSKLLLGTVFYLVLTPLSFLKRISGSTDSLKLKKPEGSVWVSRNHSYTKDDLIESF